MDSKKRIQLEKTLGQVYTTKQAKQLVLDIEDAIASFINNLTEDRLREIQIPFDLTAKDMALITYANSIEDTSGKKVPLAALAEIYQTFGINNVLPIVHLLPFYPWDTDRGFSVKNYREVHPKYGTWQDIQQLDSQAKLMFDFVANHASVENPLVQGGLIARHLNASDPRYVQFQPYKDFVIAFSEDNQPSGNEIEKLSRPRPNPVLTPYVVEDKENRVQAFLGQEEKAEGKVLGTGYVWTTFSRTKKADGSEDTRQVDLNFKNPTVFLEVIKILLFYIEQGADFIRLDAIAYIWKVLGSTSIHEPQAHMLLRVIDNVLTIAAPGSITIAEVNEPEDTYFTYLGNTDMPESDMVYQFAHFPLAIYTMITADSTWYAKWLESTTRFNGRQFTTVLGSHDGLGIKPIREILPRGELDKLTSTLVEEYGALPNYGKLPGGQEIVYEAAATPWNLINNPNIQEPFPLQLKRYLAVIMMGLLPRGVPAFYINGIIGAENYNPPGGLDENRTVNREIFDYTQLHEALNDITNRERQILDAVKNLLEHRAKQNAFDPDAPELSLIRTGHKAVIGISVPAIDDTQNLQVFINVSAEEQTVVLQNKRESAQDILTGEMASSDGSFTLKPYQFIWIPA